MPTTSNFGWTTPADTDLVKDGALAIRTLGNGVDTSMAQLKGGTTGQVLSKTSNTDMAFTWVTQDDANAIQNTIVDAKGDLITATGNDVPARLAVGNNGDTLVADSAATTGLRWQGNYAAGKNKIINGDFGIWQRGTSFTTGNGAYVYTADRWRTYFYGSNTTSISQQTFTPATAPVAGYEGTYYLRGSASNTQLLLEQLIEDVRTFAGQTVTVSFWAKSASAAAAQLSVNLVQNFGTGGSTIVTTSVINGTSTTTSWQRFTGSISVPSISGKTIGTNSSLTLQFAFTSLNNNFDLWGVQLEAGSVATAFQTATGTIQGELAACQRYYYRNTGGSGYAVLANFGSASSTTVGFAVLNLPVPMRTNPTSLDTANIQFTDLVSGFTTGTWALPSANASPDKVLITYTHGSAVLTQYRPYVIQANNNSAAYVGVSAEL